MLFRRSWQEGRFHSVVQRHSAFHQFLFLIYHCLRQVPVLVQEPPLHDIFENTRETFAFETLYIDDIVMPAVTTSDTVTALRRRSHGSYKDNVF